MSIFKSGNPTLSEKKFEAVLTGDRTDSMTVKGTLNKFFFLFLMVMGSAVFTWNAFFQGVNVFPWMIGAAIAGFVLVLIMSFKPNLSPYLAPPYGLLQGVFVGGLSASYSSAFAVSAPGIVMQAVGLTFGTVIAMFILYRTGVIRATERFKSVVFTATAGIAVFYLIAMVLRMFGIDMAFLHEGSLMGIGFSLFVVAIAALNLIMDFDMIENGSKMGAPKFMEWYGAFGLLVTIVWLYVEMLRLLSKLSSRD
jgi:uncharacterized YccA/Bax inhibitor family protein